MENASGIANDSLWNASDILTELHERNASSVDTLMEPWAYQASAFILFLIGFFGFCLNLFVIVLMTTNIQLWTPINIILFNLVCSDFLVSILGNPFTLTASLYQNWIFGKTLCTAYGFFMALLGITSISTLTVLAYERYCVILYPLTLRKVTHQEAIISIFLIWMYSLALTVPPLFGWGDYVNEAANISCSVNWETKSFNAMTYIIYLFIFGLVIPVIVISYSYINIILAMRQTSLRLGHKNRAESRVTIMVAVMIMAFLIAWTPYAVFALIEQFGPSELITPKMAVLPALIAKSSICYNPLIYVILNTQFKGVWKQKNIIKKNSIETETTQRCHVSSSNLAMSTTSCAISNIVFGGKNSKLQKARSINKLCQQEQKSQRELSQPPKSISVNVLKIKNNEKGNAPKIQVEVTNRLPQNENNDIFLEESAGNTQNIGRKESENNNSTRT